MKKYLFLSLFISSHCFAQTEDPALSLKELMAINFKTMALLDVPHTHSKGELMLSYKNMNMKMEGNRVGTNMVSPDFVLETYMVSPVKMTMQMHMLGIMYSPSDKLTLMTMLAYNNNSMSHVTRMGGEFSINTNGMGDLKISALYNLYSSESVQFIYTMGLSIPTGSIDENGITPMSMEQEIKLPYPMQLGSGTVDPILAFSIFKTKETLAYGGDTRATLRLHDNANGYHLGNNYKFTGWASKKWADWISTTLRSEFIINDNISGSDSDLNAMVAPTASQGIRGEGGMRFRLHQA